MSSAGSCRPSTTCPVWLQSALTDIEKRVKALSTNSPERTQDSDSFAERAENYYQKRPQLISLLHELHNRYLYLADRYTQSLRPYHHHRRRLSTSSALSDLEHSDDPLDFAFSDAESSLSFDRPHPPPPATTELLVAELVAAEVDREILLGELIESDRSRADSGRKVELQGSLLEVLEAERMVLLGENTRLVYQLAAATEEARALALEAAYTRQKAAELARCLIKMRADHRVCLLGRKIEELQGHIFGLERKNRECYEVMAKREVEKVEVRIEVEQLREENRRLKAAAAASVREGPRKWIGRVVLGRWWWRVRRFDWVPSPCGTELKGEEYGR